MGFIFLWLFLLVVCYYFRQLLKTPISFAQMAAITLLSIIVSEGITIFLFFNVDRYNYVLSDMEPFTWLIQYVVPGTIFTFFLCATLTYLAQHAQNQEMSICYISLVALFGTFILMFTAVLQREVEQFTEITPAQYLEEKAIDGEITQEWRYGYIQTIHFAEMVKAPNDPLLFERIVSEMDPRAAELVKLTKKHQDNVPRLASAEAVLYFLLLIITCGFVRFIYRYPSFRLLTFVLGSGMVITTALVPLLFFHYGGSLYSTYAGPGALAASSYHYHLTWVSAETVSYRIFIERLLLPSSQVFEWIGIKTWIAHLFPSHTTLLWIESLLFWSTTVILISGLPNIWYFIREKHSTLPFP
ncbi:MAG TPA: hypothetical protein P5121_31570 [Caldilineaceae bacterium]|nr:hypothetical protein [Caldilineaceae bacterium]